MPGKSYILFAGRAVFGGLGTLAVVNAVHDGVTYGYIFGVLALIMLIVGFERIVAVAELVWRNRFVREDAAATAARIAELRLEPPLWSHRTRGDRSRR